MIGDDHPLDLSSGYVIYEDEDRIIKKLRRPRWRTNPVKLNLKSQLQIYEISSFDHNVLYCNKKWLKLKTWNSSHFGRSALE